jgi:hypothetical protein
LTDLSENARFVLGKWFHPCRSMIYEMVDCVPSPEMQAALDELVQAGQLDRSNPYGKAVKYTRVGPDSVMLECSWDYANGRFTVDFPDHIPA